MPIMGPGSDPDPIVVSASSPEQDASPEFARDDMKAEALSPRTPTNLGKAP